MATISIQCLVTPYGELILGSNDSRLCLCDWRYRARRDAIDQRLQRGLQAEFVEASSPVIELAQIQLTEYFARQRRHFDVPLQMVGTGFQRAVWRALQTIAYGHTSSYRQLAERMSRPNAVRAVASANGANALSLFVPCHRVIGHDGALVGYAGGLRAKQGLLELEADLFSPPE